MPLPSHEGATLTWGFAFARRIKYSLRELARYLAREQRFDSLRALYAEIGFLETQQSAELCALAERLGFDFHAGAAPGWQFWRYAFWANVFSWWLMWTFNPVSLRGKRFANLARVDLWMSRTTLMEKYTDM